MAKTMKDIQKIKEETLQSFGNRIGNDDNRIYIMTCCGTGCTSSGAIKKYISCRPAASVFALKARF